MTNTLYLPELREMLAESDTAGLEEFCTALHPARTAEYLEGLSGKEIWAVLQYAEIPLRVEIFGFLADQRQIEIIESLDREEIATFVGELPPDDRVDLLAEVRPWIVEELMPLIPSDERRDIQRLSAYPEDTAGAVMTTEFARLSEDLPIREVRRWCVSRRSSWKRSTISMSSTVKTTSAACSPTGKWSWARRAVASPI